MKKLFCIIGCLALAGCNSGSEEGPLSAENRIISFSITSGDMVYDATVTDNGITVSVPYNI